MLPYAVTSFWVRAPKGSRVLAMEVATLSMTMRETRVVEQRTQRILLPWAHYGSFDTTRGYEVSREAPSMYTPEKVAVHTEATDFVISSRHITTNGGSYESGVAIFRAIGHLAGS